MPSARTLATFAFLAIAITAAPIQNEDGANDIKIIADNPYLTANSDFLKPAPVASATSLFAGGDRPTLELRTAQPDGPYHGPDDLPISVTQDDSDRIPLGNEPFYPALVHTPYTTIRIEDIECEPGTVRRGFLCVPVHKTLKGTPSPTSTPQSVTRVHTPYATFNLDDIECPPESVRRDMLCAPVHKVPEETPSPTPTHHSSDSRVETRGVWKWSPQLPDCPMDGPCLRPRHRGPPAFTTCNSENECWVGLIFVGSFQPHVSADIRSQAEEGNGNPIDGK